jgi:hypothetical protein
MISHFTAVPTEGCFAIPPGVLVVAHQQQNVRGFAVIWGHVGWKQVDVTGICMILLYNRDIYRGELRF